MTVRYELIPWAEFGLQRMSQWDDLVLACDANPSLAPGWLEAVARARNRLGDLEIFAATDGGRLVGVVPFLTGTVAMGGMRLRLVELAGNLVAYHHEILCAGSMTHLVQNFLRVARPDWQVFRANQVRVGSETAAAISRVANDSGFVYVLYEGERSPYMRIEGKWQEFCAGRSRAFRYRIRRRRRRIERAGRLERRRYRSENTVHEFLTLMLSIEARSWKTAAQMAVTQRPAEKRYYESLLPYLAERRLLDANVLVLDEVPVAYSLCYRDRTRIGQIKTSFDQSYAEMAPGAVLTDLLIEDAFESGAIEFDFLGPEMAHKREWTRLVRPHASYYVFARDPTAWVMGWVKRAAHTARRRRVASSRATGSERESFYAGRAGLGDARIPATGTR